MSHPRWTGFLETRLCYQESPAGEDPNQRLDAARQVQRGNWLCGRRGTGLTGDNHRNSAWLNVGMLNQSHSYVRFTEMPLVRSTKCYLFSLSHDGLPHPLAAQHALHADFPDYLSGISQDCQRVDILGDLCLWTVQYVNQVQIWNWKKGELLWVRSSLNHHVSVANFGPI